jgi:hypothetical protein
MKNIDSLKSLEEEAEAKLQDLLAIVPDLRIEAIDRSALAAPDSGVDLIISAACSQNYGCVCPREATRGAEGRHALTHRPPPRTRSYGFFTALNASHATWSFKSIKADGPGPADYSDSLTIVQASHGPRA